jgi:hypothetical protein
VREARRECTLEEGEKAHEKRENPHDTFSPHPFLFFFSILLSPRPPPPLVQSGSHHKYEKLDAEDNGV